MLSLILLCLLLYIYIYIYIYIGLSCDLYTLVNPSLHLHLCLLFSFLLQSKYKEDAFATRPILLDELEFEVCFLPFFLLFLLFCTYFLYHMPLVVSFPSQHHYQLWIPLSFIFPSFFFLSG